MLRRATLLRGRDWLAVALLVLPVALLMWPVYTGMLSHRTWPQMWHFANYNGAGQTLIYAFGSALLQTLFGVLLGCWMYESGAQRRQRAFFWWVVLLLPYGMPSMVTADLWRSFGVLLPGSSVAPIVELILASAWQFTPFATLMVFLYLSRFAGQMRRLALMDGLGEFQRVRLIYIPYLMQNGLIAAIFTFRFVLMFGKYDLPELLTFHRLELITPAAFRRSIGAIDATFALATVFVIAVAVGYVIFAALSALSRARWWRDRLAREPGRCRGEVVRHATVVARYFALVPTVYVLLWSVLPSGFVESLTVKSLAGYSFAAHMDKVGGEVLQFRELWWQASLVSLCGALMIGLLSAAVAFGFGILALRCRIEVNKLVSLAWTCAYAAPTTLIVFWWFKWLKEHHLDLASWIVGTAVVCVPLSVVLSIWVAALIPSGFYASVIRDRLNPARRCNAYWQMLHGCALTAGILAFLVTWGDVGMSHAAYWVGAPDAGNVAMLMFNYKEAHPTESNPALLRVVGSVSVLIPALFSAMAVVMLKRLTARFAP